MSGYAVVLHGERIRALMVGGGAVAARRVRGLLDAGATVRVLAPDLVPELEALHDSGAITWERGEYAGSDNIGDANLVFASTNFRAVNERVLADARSGGVMTNVADEAVSGDFSVPATARADMLLLTVFAGGVPAAAARIRDEICASVDAPLAAAVSELAALRRELILRGDVARWRSASAALIRDDFVASVRNGEFERRLGQWR